MPSTPQLTLPSASLSREDWPKDTAEFDDMFVRHGIEVRGKPFDIDWERIAQMQRQGRLVWIVARSDFGLPIGYQLSFWYRNLHWNEIEATDDMWFVVMSARRNGVGAALKALAHNELKRHGAVRVYDNVRHTEQSRLMGQCGFDVWGTRWVKTL